MGETSSNQYLKTLVVGSLISLLTFFGANWHFGKVWATISTCVVGVVVLFWQALFDRYNGVFASGGEPVGSPQRRTYDELRQTLRTEPPLAQLYTNALVNFLDSVDRFFNDSDPSHPSLFPRIFGLTQRWPLWTAPSFDRCFLLATIYPVATLVSVWLITGRNGPLQTALGLTEHMKGELRIMYGLAIVAAAAAGWQLLKAQPAVKIIFLVAAILFGILGLVGERIYEPSFFTYVPNSATLFYVCIIFTVAGIAAIVAMDLPCTAFAFGFCTVAASSALTTAFELHTFDMIAAGIARAAHKLPQTFALLDNLGVQLIVVFFFCAWGVVTVLAPLFLSFDILARRARWEWLFLLFLSIALGATYCDAITWLPQSFLWRFLEPAIVPVGMLALINAPFDWTSVGLTRALMRRGVQAGGWWPLVLAIVDVAAAIVIVALLVIATVLVFQTLNEFTWHIASSRLIAIDKILAGIRQNPYGSETWWIYAVFFSTMIPSIINITIAPMALARRTPILASRVLARMPDGAAVPYFERPLMCAYLATSDIVGAAVGLLVVLAAIYWALFSLMPSVGLDLLRLAQFVFDLQFPAKVAALLVQK